MYEGLPNVYRRLSHDVDGILAGKVKCRQNTIATLHAKHFHQSFPGRLCESCFLRLFVFLDLGLATDTRHLEQQLSDERDGG